MRPSDTILAIITLASATGTTLAQSQAQCNELFERARTPYPNGTVIDTIFNDGPRVCYLGGPVQGRNCQYENLAMALYYFLPTTVTATLATVFQDVILSGTVSTTSERTVTVPATQISSSLRSVASALVPPANRQGGGPYLPPSTVGLAPGGTMTTSNTITLVAPTAALNMAGYMNYRFSVTCGPKETLIKSCSLSTLAPVPMPTGGPGYDYVNFQARFIRQFGVLDEYLSSTMPALGVCSGHVEGTVVPQVALASTTITVAGTTITAEETGFSTLVTPTSTSVLLPPEPTS